MKVVIGDCNFDSFDHEQTMCDRAGHDLVVLQCESPEELIAQATDADALLVQHLEINEAVISRLENCKVIVLYGIETGNVDLAAARQFGIPVCNVPDYGINEVADHAAAMCLSLTRQLPFFDDAIRQSLWPVSTPTPMNSFADMTFTIFGAGRIGRATLNRMRPFGFKLAAFDPFVTAESLAVIRVKKLELDEAFEQSDVISLHMPLIEETRHLVNAQRLESMKPTSILVNTSRGELVDGHALADALKNGQIGHAGIDVHESEPLEEDHPLRDCKNALLTPHMAYYSAASVERLQRYAAEEVERALSGQALRCQVS